MASNVPEKNEDNVPDWVLAKRGINYLINNNAKEAQELFSSFPESLPMCAGYSFAAFMDALMTFEDDKLNLATSVLKEIERKCTSETGWFKSMKKAFGSSDNCSLAENLETQIILADSQVCLAILTFLQQDISGYFKGGWVLRKAWKVYQSTYQEILQLYKELGGEIGTQLPEAVVEQPMSPECSPTGSEASKSDPLNGLSLLWYHTIVRPFYALDGSNVQAGVNAATQLLQESEEEYGQSALFLFFKGRVNRLNSDIPNALKSFQSSVENATQREIKILALHEVGWCHLIQLDYCNAENTFSYLKSWSRWSRAFYSYLAGICCGSCQNSTNLTNIKEIKTGVTLGTKGNQLDEFLSRRAKCCPSDDDELSILPPIFWKLLVYEMLYLWNALPSCLPQNIEQIKRDCEQVGDGEEPMLALSKLILGCCHCIQRQFEAGIENFRLCLNLRKGCPNNAVDAHISAFSHYELGALLIKTNETKAEGKLLLQSIAQYKDYDFEQRLNVRVHSMLKQL
ncbi:tetratricopeptide repeat protein 39C-like isoform X4 [Tribolium madens]|uniref:tetratricopeptide repeat protein 39C-like isoform X4 n=1 Tax=Tribolium madens TaxID=41895 RepID=UPI001CF744C0|nr:tetratricopeptide repeat protein 39C-like isoform X4 [Tribolium madens]